MAKALLLPFPITAWTRTHILIAPTQGMTAGAMPIINSAVIVMIVEPKRICKRGIVKAHQSNPAGPFEYMKSTFWAIHGILRRRSIFRMSPLVIMIEPDICWVQEGFLQLALRIVLSEPKVIDEGCWQFGQTDGTTRTTSYRGSLGAFRARRSSLLFSARINYFSV